MTCLTLTDDVAREAIREGANLIISHHPILFKAVKRITAATDEGGCCSTWLGIRSASTRRTPPLTVPAKGINQRIAAALGIATTQPLRPQPGSLTELDAGESCRHRRHCARCWNACSRSVRVIGFSMLAILDREWPRRWDRLRLGGRVPGRRLRAGLRSVRDGRDAVPHLSGSASPRSGHGAGRHFASERPSVESLAAELAVKWSPLPVWASRIETDPIRFFPA